MKPITYTSFTPADWSAYPKDGFNVVIRHWCERHGFKRYVVADKRMMYTHLPYRKAGGRVEVAEDFLQMADAWRAKQVFRQPPLLPPV